MMKKILALVAALILAAAFSVTAMADGEVFKMGIDPEYDPFSYIGDDGNYTGFDVDVCAAAVTSPVSTSRASSSSPPKSSI